MPTLTQILAVEECSNGLKGGDYRLSCFREVRTRADTTEISGVAERALTKPAIQSRSLCRRH